MSKLARVILAQLKERRARADEIQDPSEKFAAATSVFNDSLDLLERVLDGPEIEVNSQDPNTYVPEPNHVVFFRKGDRLPVVIPGNSVKLYDGGSLEWVVSLNGIETGSVVKSLFESYVIGR